MANQSEKTIHESESSSFVINDMDGFYKIGEFAKKVGKHVNTIDGWFRQLEEKHIHYVQRSGKERIYDSLDLSIAQYICEKRDQNWSLTAIWDSLVEKDIFELRPFPIDYEETKERIVLNSEDMDNLLILKAKGVIEQTLQMETEKIARQLTQLRDELRQEMQNELKAMLPKQLSHPEEQQIERQRRTDLLIAHHKIRVQLEKEAEEEWNKKPESERMKKVGWFRKEQDAEKKMDFIRQYVNNHFEKRVKEEFDTGND
jgi:transposase